MKNQLEMTEIEVPEDVQRIIMCKKHEIVVSPLDPFTLSVEGRCKHCGKPMGKGGISFEHLKRY